MYEQHLTQAGLSPEQASVYETLTREGTLPASDLARKAGIGRTLAYKVLGELEELGLVTKVDKPGAIALFTAAHPAKLHELISARKQALESAETAVSGVIDALTSEFNLAVGKPGVRFFEGKEGIRECINDALTSKTEIYSYVDIATIEEKIPDISREFAKERQRRGLKKKNIGTDTPENRQEIEGYYTQVTEERLVPWEATKFGTVMQIYDGKVSYFTLEEPMMGTIIADPHIYEMHKSLFEFTWNDPRAYTPECDQAAADTGAPDAADAASGESSISDVSTP